MSIWGKIAGGAAGFAMGGPLGALMGTVAGHFLLDERAGRDDAAAAARADAQKQSAFLLGVIALSAKMAKADGLVTRDEVAAFRKIIKVPPTELKHVEWVFDRARESVHGYQSYAKQLRKLFAEEPAVLEDLLEGLYFIAAADGQLHAAEEDYLADVAEIFGISEACAARIRSLFVGAPEKNPYDILGVAPDISDDGLKSAYRALVREHHPDAVAARGVPEEFVQLANDRLAAINAAFDTVAAARGIG